MSYVNYDPANSQNESTIINNHLRCRDSDPQLDNDKYFDRMPDCLKKRIRSMIIKDESIISMERYLM